MIQFIKQRLLIRAQGLGWYYHPKTRRNFQGHSILATKGAFFRNHEKDDAWLYVLARNHSKIVDVGCNVGQSSMLMLLGTENSMVCIDPNPKALTFCAENLIYNRLSERVSFVNAFVGSEEGKEIEFYTVGAGAAGSMFSGFAKTANIHHQSLKVKTQTLDKICATNNFDPDFIKIDVEGAEKFVLAGIGKKVLGAQPDIFVEVHSGAELSIIENTESILSWCRQHLYKAYYLKTHSELRDVQTISKRGRYHLLLMPEDRLYPDYLPNIPENSPLSTVIA